MLRGRPAALILVAVAMFFFVVSGAAPVAASQYLGQVTWSWHKTTNEKGSTDDYETITAGLFFLGGSYYEVVGGGLDAINGADYGGGSAMLVGNNFIMTIKKSQDRTDGRKEVGIFHFVLDKTTFSGTGWAIKKRFDPATIGASPVFIDKYVAGTLTLVGNPPPLGPATAAPMQLLLSD